MLLIMIDRRFLQDPINNIHDTASTLYLDTQEYTYNEKQTSGDGCVMMQVHTLEEKDAHIRSLCNRPKMVCNKICIKQRKI